jgi:hypothetical protein
MLTNRSLRAVLFLAIIICLFIPLGSAGAANGTTLTAFSGFVTSVMDGQANVVRGVYVPGVLALRVMQQPAGDNTSVLRLDGVATQFNAAAQNHVIGLLAHNDKAGAAFTGLKIGQEVRIVYGDGQVDYYVVNLLASYQALQLGGEVNNFLDMRSNITYTVQDIFKMFYAGAGHVTFQTCILKDANPSWGRFFVTAVPIPAMDTLQKSQKFIHHPRQDTQLIQQTFDFLTGMFSFR